MSDRHSAVRTVIGRDTPTKENGKTKVPSNHITDNYGCRSFNEEAMHKYLGRGDYKTMKDSIAHNKRLEKQLAERVADGMRKWAKHHGATDYAHWFQPWTGKTAGKHDSFFTLDRQGKPIETFNGSQLLQGEPDGSSFPGGGLRTTFEARGYTAWDPSSPAFIVDRDTGRTLCIPSVFVTYGGYAMDNKLPLLRSQDYLTKAAISVCQLFDPSVNKVDTTLGWEQEYFLIDQALFYARPDLLMCGRTLLGKTSPKGQQMEDHYFGSIPERVFAFQKEVEQEAHQLGIPLRTRHNEVAPAQYEFAPMYEQVVVATDHNLLLMELMERVAKRHGLKLLLSEKPFAGINGSGKHCNFSLKTNTGVNLLTPGTNPSTNLQFLVFFICIIKGVHEYAEFLRASMATGDNDHRLGGNEAPPAIMSIFIGEALTKVLSDLKQGVQGEAWAQEFHNLVEHIPSLFKDNTDRNRTSPFAFTGDKFEIRTAGSSINCALPMMAVSTILGNQLKLFKDEYDATRAGGTDHETAIHQMLQEYLKTSSAVLYEGDNYSEEWVKEAEARGLPNLKTTPQAWDAVLSDKVKQLVTTTGTFRENELHALYDVHMDQYFLKAQLESRTMGELVSNHVIPKALQYQSELAKNIEMLKQLDIRDPDISFQVDNIKAIAQCVRRIHDDTRKMTSMRRKANGLKTAGERAKAYSEDIKNVMQNIRSEADRLEYIIPDPEWPLVKYREMLFIL